MLFLLCIAAFVLCYFGGAFTWKNVWEWLKRQTIRLWREFLGLWARLWARVA